MFRLNRVMKIQAFLLATVLASPLCFGQYRCVVNGKTLITDKPCASDPAAPAPKTANTFGDAKNSAYTTNYGAWRGQVQFMAKSGADVISDAHAVAPIVIEVDPQGKVSGSSTETGCFLKGIALPGAIDYLTNLDVTLTKCHFPGYNRQMSGRLILHKTERYTDFQLVSYDMIKRPVAYYEIKGTLRR